MLQLCQVFHLKLNHLPGHIIFTCFSSCHLQRDTLHVIYTGSNEFRQCTLYRHLHRPSWSPFAALTQCPRPCESGLWWPSLKATLLAPAAVSAAASGPFHWLPLVPLLESIGSPRITVAVLQVRLSRLLHRLRVSTASVLVLGRSLSPFPFSLVTAVSEHGEFSEFQWGNESRFCV